MADVKSVRPGWFNLFRPWTLHGAVVPVLIGWAVAFREGLFDASDALSWSVLALVLTGGCLLQSAANILNTYGDFVKGTDTVENETRSPELVAGTLSKEKALSAGLACLGATVLIGLILIWYSDWGILVYGLLGMAGAGLYTVGISYKYHGFGQASVFLMMGVLMPLGTYHEFGGGFSMDTLLIGLPNAFMITGVLCGNELRDYYEDKKVHVGTLCGHMSYGNAKWTYHAENLIGYPILAALIMTGAAPWPCALAFLALYDAYRMASNASRASADPGCNRLLVPRAFTHNWHFGVLLVVGYLLADHAIGAFRYGRGRA